MTIRRIAGEALAWFGALLFPALVLVILPHGGPATFDDDEYVYARDRVQLVILAYEFGLIAPGG